MFVFADLKILIEQFGMITSIPQCIGLILTQKSGILLQNCIVGMPLMCHIVASLASHEPVTYSLIRNLAMPNTGKGMKLDIPVAMAIECSAVHTLLVGV